MSKSLTVKKFITLACEALDGLSKNDARETYKSIKESKNPVWSDFTHLSTLLCQKVELNEQIEELEEEIDDDPDNKDQYITKINTILSSESTIKLIHTLETGFNKKHGTFAQIYDNYSINITTLQNYKHISIPPSKTKKPPKTSKKTKTKTPKNAKSKLNKQKSTKKNTKSNSKLNRQKPVKNGNKNTKKNLSKGKSIRKAGKSSTTESTSKYKRRNNAKTDKSKNLSPSKMKRLKLRNRSSSTGEDIKNGKVKATKNDKRKKGKRKDKKVVKNKDTKSKKGKKKDAKKNEKSKPKKSTSPKTVKIANSKPLSPKSPATPKSPISPTSNDSSTLKMSMSPQVSETGVYGDDGEETKVELQNVASVESVESEERDMIDSPISTQSQNRSSAFAMFERLSSPKVNNGGFFGSETATHKVQKKGKRYFDFKEFSSGAFSKVYKAKDKQNNDRIVAVKKIHIGGNRDDDGFEPTTKEEGDNEIRILKLVNDHHNTCNLIETYFDMKLGINSGYVLCIVMEYMHYTLKDRMDYYGEKGECIPLDLIKIYLFQFCKAVNWMHIKNVCHRDIKPENVLINTKTNRLQLCDFGCSILLGKNQYNDDEKYQYEESEDGNETYVMSRFYRAPELILGNRLYDCYADIWSLGVVISELFLGTILFMGSSNLDQMREIILKLGWPTKEQLKDMNPSITKFDKIDGVYGVDKSIMGESFNMIFMGVMDMDENAIDLISELLVYSPDERLSAGECLEHDYFNDVKSLMNKSIKKKKNFEKNNKKMKKEDIIPNNLFDWNEMEIKYAKEKNIKLKK